MLDVILNTESDNVSDMGLDFILADEQDSINHDKHIDSPLKMSSPMKRVKSSHMSVDWGLTRTMTHESDIAIHFKTLE